MYDPRDLLADIRQENLKVYRSSPQRLREDVGQESQIAQDYRGRLIYELLQNADDAMDASGGDARISFEVTGDSLWVANSGRPLDDADIRGLCGISASSKRVRGKRRASIGHKGMGFKSVLEISDAPEVYSTSLSFRFSPREALAAVQPLVDEGLVEPIRHAPVCRFPWPIEKEPACWSRMRDRGFRTAFCFPLRAGELRDLRTELLRALKSLPESSLLFLKRLKAVEIELGDEGGEAVRWSVKRQQYLPDGLKAVNGLSESGVYNVQLSRGDGTDFVFLLAHDAEIPIGDHRGGLNEVAWENVELTEAAVASRMVAGEAADLPPDWRKLHVFLPSSEPCPYDLLISGAFNSNLSRQEIKIGSSTSDYNGFLLQRVAGLFRDQLLPALIANGTSTEGVLRLLRLRFDTSEAGPNGAAQVVYESFRRALADCSLVPTEAGPTVPISHCVVPPIVSDASVGEAFRKILPGNAAHGEHLFPMAQFCGGDLARIIVDHGAQELSPVEAATRLADPDPDRASLREHSSGGLDVDPVLSVLEGLWQGLSYEQRLEFGPTVRQLPLFPTAEVCRRATRVATADLQCFYPPRSLKGEVGLSGLCFLMQNLCWGALIPMERNQLLAREMPIWQALFDLHEFKFPEVMRASVLPALDLDSAADDQRRMKLRSIETLAAICQLAGRMPDASKPLPYERLGPNRALFNLSRLDVPCRGGSQDAVKWVPAYRAYLGEDWVNDASFERVCKAITAAGGAAPEVDFLVPPDRFAGLLDRFRHLESMTSDDAEDVGEDEVRLDEDEESALDTNDQDRWLEFFQWIGVNQVLRPVHFHDVEDRASGWLTTRNLRRPEGWAFTNIPEEKWNSFLQEISSKVAKEIAENPGAVPYFYRLHDLEHVVSLLDAAARDVSTGIGRAMYEHWARNWLLLETFAQLDVALVTGEPRRRAKPPRAYEEEILQLEESNFWVFRLRHAAVCPTGHGPRKPAEVWFPTQEVLRRFGRKTRDGQACLLPTIDLPAALLKGRARGIMQVMGIREELSPASFMEEDASVVLRRLEEVFGARVAHGDDLRQELREVIRPAYRHVLELLSGKTSSSGSTLKNAPLLAHDGEGHYAFRQANDVFYVERRDTRDRLRADVPIWTFVLEAYPAGRTPLVELLSCRVLEQAIKWRPRIGDPSLHSIDEATWRAHLRELAPYILARVGADRVEEGQARRDAAMLRQLILGLEPVMDIQLGCELDGHELPTKLIEREAFVDQDEAIGKMIVAYVRWGEGVWPPDEDDAEALATAFGEVLGAGYFESFLALIRAPSDARRESLLKRAGAPTDIEERRALLFENDPATGGVGLAPTEQQSEEPKTASAPSDGEEAAKQPPSSPPGTDRPVQVPLFTPDQLAIDGAPVTLIGTYTGAQEKHQRPEKNTTANPNDHNNDASNRTGYGGHTDLDALNSLGMAVTMAYELARLKKVGHGDVRAFDASSSDPQPDAVVFDVSTPARIATARTACPSFAQAFRRLSSTYGVSAEWPGFDVLTLVPGRHGEIDRMIELKASGVSARIQEMSWNEWKSARNNELRQCFYLYLVGNLRSDLQGNNPFVRTIRDPFGQLLAETQVSQRIERRVQLATHLFREAEHLDLTVRGEARSEL